MFVMVDVFDTIRIEPSQLAVPTVQAIHSEIDQKYPNRVLMDVGLVVCRHGDCYKVSHGVCVAGDGGSHHDCAFRLVVFRPFVEEVCIGRILKSTADGIQVSLGFFEDIFIPTYWMLRPSEYEERTGLWVWTPQYDDDDDDNEGGDEEEQGDAGGAAQENNDEKTSSVAVKMEDTASTAADDIATNGDDNNNDDAIVVEDEGRYEMEIGSEIRFKVKSLNFTQVTNTAKGMQATTTTTAQLNAFPGTKLSRGGEDVAVEGGGPVRRRSSSVGLDETSKLPASMHIVASICEDGLGCTSWWASPDEEEGEQEAVENGDAAHKSAIKEDTISNGQ